MGCLYVWVRQHASPIIKKKNKQKITGSKETKQLEIWDSSPNQSAPEGVRLSLAGSSPSPWTNQGHFPPTGSPPLLQCSVLADAAPNEQLPEVRPLFGRLVTQLKGTFHLTPAHFKSMERCMVSALGSPDFCALCYHYFPLNLCAKIAINSLLFF